MENTQSYVTKAVELIMVYGPKFILAIIVLFLGLWIIKFITKMISKSLDHSKIELSLQKFLNSLVSALLKVLLFISVASWSELLRPLLSQLLERPDWRLGWRCRAVWPISLAVF